VSRNTIAGPTSIDGVGLHLGVECRLTFVPAPSGSGIAFKRTDLPGSPVIRAHVDTAVLTERQTQLGNDPVAVHTVEHVLAAVGALEIDDLVVELSGPEPPIVDGSAKPFVDALLAAGIKKQSGAVQYLDLKEPVKFTDGISEYEAFPASDLQLDVLIEFPHKAIGLQHGTWRITPDRFAAELAPARTFGFVHEVEALRSRGLIKGASTKNAVVLDEAGVVETTLRWPDEFVRHKALDCVGDLTLAGGRVRAKIVARRPSHRGTVQLVRAIRASISKGANVAELGIEDIMKVLPHRYPFLLVDRIVELDPGKRVVGIKNVTINEPFFAGHFPGHPIMPGVLIIEAMAQVGGMLLLGAIEDPQSKVVYFTSLNNVKWRRPVKPGDQLRFELDLLQVRGMVCKMAGVAKVDGEVVAEAEMGAMMRDR
jgi:UDP-3-O-[3-hydroxymyristoyl] N-acetylglucosamine deacetylase/3-hydroxyacyl-[acyl-carrier-protein] dehydratase